MPRLTITLPDFVIIGANKAGTTSVANYLNQHPAIKIAEVKEPMFFSADPAMPSAERDDAHLGQPYYADSIREYSSLFQDESAQVRLFGEASTSYLATPWQSARLLYKLVPEIKVIAILRDPVHRAVSAYKMCVGNGIESRAFAEIVDQVRRRPPKAKAAHGVREYVRNGLYGQLLQPYIDYFPERQRLFLNYDELCSSPALFMQKLAHFLALDDFDFDTQARYNTASANLQLEQPVSIREADLQTLRYFYQQDIERTEKLTGLDLQPWKLARPSRRQRVLNFMRRLVTP